MSERKHTNRLIEMPPCLPGVYQIVCLPTGKLYIGSALDLRTRWNHHRQSLRRGKHRNQHLQNAWNRYSETSFEFSIIELTTEMNLLQVEQMWIDKTRCADRKIG
ncbi:MAG: GIY-YIG nuclease family protein, partial [Pyrinomonadaceae bacterium]